jgi:hypothetical protein
MKMNSDDKFNEVIAFKISALLLKSDLKISIAVDLSAWTAAFAPSLLSDPPRVFDSSRPPTLNMSREFNAAPAATDRSRHHRSRSTWGLVSRLIGSISSLISRHLP